MLELLSRDLIGQYRGSFGGWVWSFAEPLFMFVVYVAAFGYILQTRWTASGDTREYAFMLFAGLIIFQAFAECLSRAPLLIVANPNFVKKIVFPLEILPWVMCASVMVHLSISTLLWVIGYAVLFGVPHGTVLLTPLILIAFFPVLLAVGWLLAAIGVIVRDVSQLTGMAARALLFMTPVFYGVHSAPLFLRKLLRLNPLTFIIEQFRVVLFEGALPNFFGLSVYFVCSCACAAVSLFVFQRLRPMFSDNL